MLGCIRKGSCYDNGQSYTTPRTCVTRTCFVNNFINVAWFHETGRGKFVTLWKSLHVLCLVWLILQYIMKRKLYSDGHQFHQYQQNEQSRLILTQLAKMILTELTEQAYFWIWYSCSLDKSACKNYGKQLHCIFKNNFKSWPTTTLFASLIKHKTFLQKMIGAIQW
jgi:hypothetical protein